MTPHLLYLPSIASDECLCIDACSDSGACHHAGAGFLQEYTDSEEQQQREHEEHQMATAQALEPGQHAEPQLQLQQQHEQQHEQQQPQHEQEARQQEAYAQVSQAQLYDLQQELLAAAARQGGERSSEPAGAVSLQHLSSAQALEAAMLQMRAAPRESVDPRPEEEQPVYQL